MQDSYSIHKSELLLFAWQRAMNAYTSKDTSLQFQANLYLRVNIVISPSPSSTQFQSMVG